MEAVHTIPYVSIKFLLFYTGIFEQNPLETNQYLKVTLYWIDVLISSLNMQNILKNKNIYRIFIF